MKTITIPYKPFSLQESFHKNRKRWSIEIAHRRFGKCLDIKTEIPTLNGFKKIVYLAEGDIVFDENGKQCKVVGVSDIKYNKKCYKVLFSDGAEVICDEDHLWFTQTKLDRAHKNRTESKTGLRREGSNKTAKEIYETQRFCGENNHSIPNTKPVEYNGKIDFDPYFLGLWLGDGTSRRTEITTMDIEIKDYLESFAEQHGQFLKPTTYQGGGKATTYIVSNGTHYTHTKLNKLSLLNNKHIPPEYMVADVDTRIELFRGLMDTDGTISKYGHCEYCSKLEHLADSFCELISGLGMKYTKLTKVIDCKNYYRITFTPTIQPFKIKRKADRYNQPSFKAQNRYIVSVEPVETRPVVCIKVDSESELFLCTRWNIPTHNTVEIVNELIKSALTNTLERPRVFYIAPFLTQAKSIAWDYAKHYSNCIPGVKFNESELRIDYPNGGRFQLLGADKPDRLRGIYIDDIGLDEYDQMRPNLFDEIIRPALADRKGRAIFMGTPKGKLGLYKLWQKNKDNPNWTCRILKASETKHISEEELMEAKASMSKEMYEQEFECSFEAAAVGAYYAEELNRAKKEQRICKVPYDTNLKVHTAWDIGWRDDTSIIFFQIHGKEIRLIDFYTASGMTIADYSKILKDKPYQYEDHFFPHDAFARRMSDGKSTVDFAVEYGIQPTRTPDLSILEGINTARIRFKDMWFDEDKCKDLIEALSQYRREFDEKNKVFRQNPLHDWSSHPADAFRYMAISTKPEDEYDSTVELRDFINMD